MSDELYDKCLGALTLAGIADDVSREKLAMATELMLRFVKDARTDGYRAGLEAAAEIADNLAGGTYLDSGEEILAAIRALAAKEPNNA